MSEENKENLENSEMNEESAAETENMDNTPAETEDTGVSAEAENADDSAEAEAAEVSAEAEDTEVSVEAESTDDAADAEDADTAVDAEAADDSVDNIEGAADITGDVIDDGIEAAPIKNKPKTGLIVGIIIAAVVVIAAIIVLVFGFGKNLFNKYNRMGYIDVSGRTIAEIADQSGYELADFLAVYGLPADMPGSTSESAAYYNIPCSKIAEMYGMSFDDLKSMLQWGDDITEDTTWGEAEGETTIAAYVGEANVASFKEQYGFGDEITGETKWKEVRNTIDQQMRDARIEQEKAAEDAANATEAPAEEATAEPAADAAEATEAPAATEQPAA